MNGMWLIIAVSSVWIAILYWLTIVFREREKKLHEMHATETIVLANAVKQAKEQHLNQQIHNLQQAGQLTNTVIRLCQDKIKLYQEHTYLREKSDGVTLHLELLEGMVQDIVQRDAAMRAAVIELSRKYGKDRELLHDLLALFPN